jgi:hypothetical protein
VLFTKYPKQGIALFVGFGKAMNTPPSFKIYVMEPNVFLGYPTRETTCALSIPSH